MEDVDYESPHRILDQGFPVDISSHAVPRYLARIHSALSSLGSLEDPTDADALPALKLLTARVIATEHHDPAAAAILNRQVQKLADQLDSDLARGYALLAWSATHPTPEHTTDRIKAARKIMDIARDTGEPDLLQAGLTILLIGLLEAGDLRSDTQLLDAASEPADQIAGARPVLWFNCLRSILDGDTELAERQARELVPTTAETQSEHHHLMMTESLAVYFIKMGMIRWMQGRVDHVEDVLLRARRAYPTQLLWPTSLAWLWLLQGRTSAGSSLLRSLPEPEDIPRDRYWLCTTTVMAEIAIIHGPRERAERLQRILLPFAEHLVPVGAGVAFWGTGARTLGLLEERLGMLDLAKHHLQMAVEKSGKIGAIPWLTEAQIELANFALRHDLTDIPAYDLLAEARTTSQARGFTRLAVRALAQPRIRVLGQFDVVSVCGCHAEWTSRKARELLKMLVASRGVPTSREVFMEVLWPGVDPSRLGNRFSVAVNVIRRNLDPDRSLPTQYFLITEGESVRLELKNLDIDLEKFLTLVKRPDPASHQAAQKLYRGAAFTEEPYADWAVTIRDHAHLLWEKLDSAESWAVTD
ncbi:hypothetical protein CFAEC_11205 [Corynebacterium faecale]|uniref:AfsR/SARP family transcriptional regulator n=1 Tax=Corynebacterium faecale TaxID=1758466 RepID=UPI0025B5F41E|nr:hypothetical protein [Corynebacterium faecale]WJY93040.1 hypothetical protein CFAEC_11205 [Corynebacterium faecale]